MGISFIDLSKLKYTSPLNYRILVFDQSLLKIRTAPIVKEKENAAILYPFTQIRYCLYLTTSSYSVEYNTLSGFLRAVCN